MILSEAELNLQAERAEQLVHAIAEGTKPQTLRQKIDRAILYFLVGAVVFIGIVVIIVRGTANDTAAALRLSCPAWEDVATAPLAPDTKGLGIAIVADARRAYEASCVGKYGQLPPADPRIMSYLELHP